MCAGHDFLGSPSAALHKQPVVGAKLMPWSEYPALFFPGVSKFSWYLPWQDKSVESESIDIPEFTHSAVLRFATAEWRVR